MPEQALSDLKVLDLSQHVSGPFSTRLLADYGADVIKIEPPGEGDPGRKLPPFLKDDPHPEKSGLFVYLNTNKRGITLNLQSQEGANLFREMVKTADVVVENFAPGTLEAWGLGYEELAKLNPRLVLTSITPFGQTGPYAKYKAPEIVIFAMSTVMFAQGKPGREPVKYHGYKALLFGGSAGAAGTMAAVAGVDRLGVGQQVDLSIMEAMVGCSERGSGFASYAYSRTHTYRMGAAGSSGGQPYGTYPTADGFINTIIIGERGWRRMVAGMKMPELRQDPRFLTPLDRLVNVEAVDEVWRTWLLQHTTMEVVEVLQEQRLPVVPAYSIDEIFDDPQYKARGLFVEVDHPVIGRHIQPGAPFIMSETPWQMRRPAPTLGQHNAEVYGELGLSQADLTRLQQSGVI